MKLFFFFLLDFDFYETHGETTSSTRLVCDGAGGSSHPRADIACKEITAIKGDAQQLVDASASTASCTSKHSDPVVVSIQGKFQGKPFDFFHQFDSLCAMKAQTSRAPAFVNALSSDEA
ncbi:hypothetical protein BC940DRAFT_294027 [Gongronella butleri]|nr:hypothetical protein BC940DRAFT_294027 [Gongronella butleri]